MKVFLLDTLRTATSHVIIAQDMLTLVQIKLCDFSVISMALFAPFSLFYPTTRPEM